MLSTINIKVVWKPKKFLVSYNKNYIIMILIAEYLLIGLAVAFLLEHVIRWTGNDVTGGERYSMIVLWPIMTIVFIFYFIKGILED